MAETMVLIVDDEEKMLEVVSAYLLSKGMRVLTATNGADGMDALRRNQVSIVLLDLMLPDIAGEQLCRQIRKNSRVPIIMLTAKSASDDMLNGFQLGADDYVVKPFSLKELHARVEAVLRRSDGYLESLARRMSWNNDDLVVDFDKAEVRKRGAVVDVTPKEWRILSALVTYPHKVFSRDNLIEIAFEGDFDRYDRVVDTHVKNLRKKIEDDPKNPRYLKTVHGLGYKFGGEDV